jgi:hypothetical protein
MAQCSHTMVKTSRPSTSFSFQCSRAVNPAVEPDRVSAPADFSVQAVQQSLKQAKRSRSSGPDGFPSMFWANLSSELALPISVIFSLSYSFTALPDDWRHALVVPLHTKGNPVRFLIIGLSHSRAHCAKYWKP